jgi:hypothetical protein
VTVELAAISAHAGTTLKGFFTILPDVLSSTSNKCQFTLTGKLYLFASVKPLPSDRRPVYVKPKSTFSHENLTSLVSETDE